MRAMLALMRLGVTLLETSHRAGLDLMCLYKRALEEGIRVRGVWLGFNYQGTSSLLSIGHVQSAYSSLCGVGVAVCTESLKNVPL